MPYYVPGTEEIGEMLVIPRISDEGFLIYQFDFIDPVATLDNVKESISIFHEDIENMIMGLTKVDEWTEIAQREGVNRRISKKSGLFS